ncbi:MAG: hypothetical protein J6R04_04265, partial [Clostridia bacterium]|nr:hypothetical protein [Clostridia bacterium]
MANMGIFRRGKLGKVHILVKKIAKMGCVLNNFSSLRSHCALRARARGKWSSFFALWQRTKQEIRTRQAEFPEILLAHLREHRASANAKLLRGLCPLDSRGAARQLSIFPPRGKNVCQHFSS